jgi:phosphoglycerol transferase MdoB-like AlkP superfamily enzyme
MIKIKDICNEYLKLTVPLLITFFLFRIFEYCSAGIKMSLAHHLLIVFTRCLYYDIYTWLIYCAVLFLPFLFFWILHKKTGRFVLLMINVLIVAGFFGLLVVFSERLVPFDHEIFMRKSTESFSIVLQVFGGRLWIAFSFLLYVSMYLFFYRFVFFKYSFSTLFISIIISLSVASVFTIKFSMPSMKNYSQLQEYYLVTNKLQYFIADDFSYLLNNSKKHSAFEKKDVDKEIEEYQSKNNFQFTDKEYPLLHLDESKDVLKNFLRSSDTVPNIVMIIFEGLSRDFSGDDAIAGSFTPFLDSLSHHSLSWYNFLSNAQGTFGSLPSLIGAMPFGERGFTLQTNTPEHITLCKILKRNNWQTYYFTGADMNFDNFGPFMRLQGTDYLLTKFGPKYRKMGTGTDGISSGYPDDALFDRSLEVLDSVNRTPYLSIYLTVTTHTPFVFAQSSQYEKLFEQVMKRRNLKEKEKNRLRIYKPLWASFLFSDNCLRHFFAGYRKRKEFKNTIFIIVGDHHHGFYPTRNEIDDYNVPFLIYSPLLKKSVNFKSVNCHMNVTPTLLAYLKANYPLKYFPRYVSWLTGELDTCRTFRNIHHIPFMLTNRDIDDYLYEDYYIAGALYKLKPDLNLEDVADKKEEARMTSIRENFRFINSYVCAQNKLFPYCENIYDNRSVYLRTFSDSTEHNIAQHILYQSLVKDFKPPSNFKKVLVKVSFKIKFASDDLELLPYLLTYIYSANGKKELLCSSKKIYEFIHPSGKKNEWTGYVDEDMFNLDSYPDPEGHLLKVCFYNRDEIKMKIKDLSIKFFGVE